MKSTGVCPKCSSKRVAAIPSELGTYNAIKVDMFGFANLTRFICTSCGYMEQYVSDENALTKLRGKRVRQNT
jgi:predicted nucleic-acid-binding Zn-ribbon protein